MQNEAESFCLDSRNNWDKFMLNKEKKRKEKEKSESERSRRGGVRRPVKSVKKQSQ